MFVYPESVIIFDRPSTDEQIDNSSDDASSAQNSLHSITTSRLSPGTTSSRCCCCTSAAEVAHTTSLVSSLLKAARFEKIHVLLGSTNRVSFHCMSTVIYDGDSTYTICMFVASSRASTAPATLPYRPVVKHSAVQVFGWPSWLL